MKPTVEDRPRRRVHAFVDVLRRGVSEEVGDEQEDDQRVLDGVHDQQVVATGLGSVRQRVDLSGDDGSKVPNVSMVGFTSYAFIHLMKIIKSLFLFDRGKNKIIWNNFFLLKCLRNRN